MIKNKIDLYLAKCFLKNFFVIIFGFWIVFFLVNLIDLFGRIEDDKVETKLFFILSFLKTPQNLSSIIVSTVLISSIYTFFQLSNRSEIAIIRNCGYSLWRITSPLAGASIFLAILWVTIFNLFEIWAVNKFNFLESKYIETEMRETLNIGDGIWFRQKNLVDNDNNIIIVTRKIYKNSVDLYSVSLWFFDKKNNFYKRIDADKMHLSDKKWLIKNAIVNDETQINQPYNLIQIPTEIDEEFLKNKIVNNFDTVEFFSIFELPKVIRDLEKSGLNAKKFKTYFHAKLSYVILFVAMILLATFFGIGDARSKKSNIKLFVGIVFGLVIFLISSIFFTLGSSGFLSTFEATWLIGIIYLAMGILLIYKKEISGS